MKRFSRPSPPEAASPALTPWRLRRYTDHAPEEIEAGVVVEEPLEIRIGGRAVATLMRTPGLEKELAAGFCLGEGLVARPEDVALVRHCGRGAPDELAEGDALDESRNVVDVTLVPGAAGVVERGGAIPVIRSGCGRTDVADLAAGLAPVGGTATVRLAVLHHLVGQLTPRQWAYRAAGGIHAAAVFDTLGRLVAVAEDVGRHNAVDKVTGYCLLRGIPLGDKLLMSTGRASYDMVAKGIRLGIPILASISSPTSTAVELALALNCTLLGYLRGKTLNVYTHPHRVIDQ